MQLKNAQKIIETQNNLIKLNLKDESQQRIFRRKTDKHNYFVRYDNLRKAIDIYLGRALAMVINIMEPRVIVHEELRFSDKSKEEGGQGGYLKMISQSMFKNFDTFSSRVSNWLGKNLEFLGVNANNTSKISFVNRYIRQIPLDYCRHDKTGNSDYSYIIAPIAPDLGQFSEIRCIHEDAAGNILYRGFLKYSEGLADAVDKPPPVEG